MRSTFIKPVDLKDQHKVVVVTLDSHPRVEGLQSDQEKADSKMILHVQHAVKH